MIPSTVIAVPAYPAPAAAGLSFLVGTCVILAAILLWWLLSGERHRHGYMLPLVFAGTALSAVLIEPIFDNTLLYWYPPVNDLAFFRGYDRTIPYYVPLGYAWFFGGNAYLLARLFAKGVGRGRVWLLFAGTVAIDWLAVSICEWLDLSAFYGPQPFHLVGSPLWFSFCDATGAFVLAAALRLFGNHLTGERQAWLLVLPTFTYGGTLGSVTAPVSLALNSGWSAPWVWAGGAATMVLCMMAIHVIAGFASRERG